MTNQAPPAPWTGNQTPYQDPKAAAAAAKAYAKATRPWYQKKRWIIPMVIVGLMVIGSLAGGSDTDGSDAGGPEKVDTSGAAADTKAVDTKSDNTKSDAKAKAGTESNPIKIGQTVKLEGTQYTVKSVRKSAAVGGEFMQENADGTFVTVTLTIENKKSETKTFSDSAAKFVTSDGKSYSTDSEGTIAVMGTGEEPLFLTDMQPDLPTTGKLVFDVPPAKVKGGVLEVSDLFGGGEAYIALGLR